jgi:5-methylcytosine-specific restriction endonuclease McrA
MPGRFSYTLGDEKARNRFRSATQPWRAWYNTSKWQRLRQIVLKRDRWTCQRTGELCIGKGQEPNAPVINHKIPHRGDEKLFWDIDNLELVAKHVHDSEIQSEERGFGF